MKKNGTKKNVLTFKDIGIGEFFKYRDPEWSKTLLIKTGEHGRAFVSIEHGKTIISRQHTTVAIDEPVIVFADPLESQ